MRLAVYGTLRKEGTLRHYLGKDSQFVETTTLTGWDMFSLGSYPYVRRGNGKILVEIYQVPNEDMFGTMHMELAAGYSMTKVYDYGLAIGSAYMFYMDSNKRNNDEPIPSGDWIQYFKAKQKEYEEQDNDCQQY